MSVADCLIFIPSLVVVIDISLALLLSHSRFSPASPVKADKLLRFSSNFPASSPHFLKPNTIPVRPARKEVTIPKYVLKPLVIPERDSQRVCVVFSESLCS